MFLIIITSILTFIVGLGIGFLFGCVWCKKEEIHTDIDCNGPDEEDLTKLNKKL